MTALLFTIITFFSTLAGGLFALRFRDHLHLLLAFSAGVLIGVAFLDVLPEAHHRHSSVLTMALTIAGVGFVFALVQVVKA